MPLIKKLATYALKKDITLLCVEEDPIDCHRKTLAQECKIHEPNLIIIHR